MNESRKNPRPIPMNIEATKTLPPMYCCNMNPMPIPMKSSGRKKTCFFVLLIMVSMQTDIKDLHFLKIFINPAAYSPMVKMDNLEESIRKYALQNALLHDGKANYKAVMGKIMAENPSLRSRAKELIEEVRRIVEEVNKLSVEEQRRKLEEIAPELLERKKKEEKKELEDLPDVRGEVRMRLAPSPSGPMHLGQSRMAILNDEYVKRYGGKLFLRIEDTNPHNILPEAYDMIPEDLEWLGVKVHEIVIQSDRFEIYYDYARKLLEMSKAYITEVPAEEWRRLKNEGKATKDRELPPEEAADKMNDAYAPHLRVMKGDKKIPENMIKTIAVRNEMTGYKKIEEDKIEGGIWVYFEKILPAFGLSDWNGPSEIGYDVVLTSLLTDKKIEDLLTQNIKLFKGSLANELIINVVHPVFERVKLASKELRELINYIKKNHSDIVYAASVIHGLIEGERATEKIGKKTQPPKKIIRDIEEYIKTLPEPPKGILPYITNGNDTSG